jgi:hypothetical protein
VLCLPVRGLTEMRVLASHLDRYDERLSDVPQLRQEAGVDVECALARDRQANQVYFVKLLRPT